MYCKCFKFEVFALIIAFSCVQASTVEDAFYTAGVVEFAPVIGGMSSSDMVREHVRAYVDLISSSEAYETDIIVFPEGTLNNELQLTFIPNPKDQIIPCLDESDTYAEFLMLLSCAAQSSNKYLVINVIEKENCTEASYETNDLRPCASNGLNIYNTNVVFDRNGTVISRYRKINIYTEAKNTTHVPEFGIFDTDFGVRFGHFICFDILFYIPAQELVRSHGIKDFIFTSWFYSELPFLTATQVQQSWAWGNDVNLLAAGASNPAGGTTGTGIYVGNKGHVQAHMAGQPGIRQIHVARVPKYNDTIKLDNEEMFSNYHTADYERQTAVKLMRDPRIEDFTSELIDFTQINSVSRELCVGEFCCVFSIETEIIETSPTIDFYQYRIGIFSGNRTYEKEEWSELQICAIYACTNDSITSCGALFESNKFVSANFVFKAIHIEGNFEKTERLLIMPTSLDEQLYPLTSDSVEWSVTNQGEFYNVKFSLKTEKENLLTFGIYANYYDRSGSSRNIFTRELLILFFGLLLIIKRI